MLSGLVISTFVIILALVALLEGISSFTSKKVNTNPQFLKFQRIYFLVYYPVLLGDWLNAPYLYKLYTSYGFLEEQIAIIYVCGFASALVCGIISGHFVQRYGHCRVFVLATLSYAVSSLIKLSSDYSALIIGRIMSGTATSLLFTAQEMWYIDKHIKTYDFPPEWVSFTFTKSSKGNGILAILAGIIAYFMSEVYGLGPVAPSVLSFFVLLCSCGLAIMYWNKDLLEIYNSESKMVMSRVLNKPILENKKRFKEYLRGLRTIAQSSDLLQVGFIQALFESVLCMFVFLWTPVLDHHNPPLGIVFASFMAATLLGGALYRIGKSIYKHGSPTYSLFFLLTIAGGAVLLCVWSTEPTREFPIVSFLAFLLFELGSGMYFPIMSDLKREIELDKVDFALTTWFRVPLNLLSCCGLLFLHSSSNLAGTRNLFICCVILILIAITLSLKFMKSVKGNRTDFKEMDIQSA